LQRLGDAGRLIFLGRFQECLDLFRI